MDRRGALRKLFALAGCAAAATLCSTQRAEGANYGYRAGPRCPACGTTVVAIHSWRRDGRHWHCHGGGDRASWWYH